MDFPDGAAGARGKGARAIAEDQVYNGRMFHIYSAL